MESKAVEKYIKMSPRKIKYVIDTIKKKRVEEAVGVLSLMPKSAAVYVKKAIQSASANAIENFKDYKVKEEDLFIKEIFVTQGPTLKRFKPRAKGRADRVLKKSAHITVFVSDGKSGKDEKISKQAKKEAKV